MARGVNPQNAFLMSQAFNFLNFYFALRQFGATFANQA
jgi:hypothetical protein